MRTDSIGPVPRRLLSLTRSDGELVPAWFSERDRPWLRDLLQEAEAAAGQPFAQLERRWRQSDPDPRAGARLWIARHVLRQLLHPHARRPDLVALRRELFGAVAAGLDQTEALRRAAAARGCAAATLVQDLFADLPPERRITWPTAGIEPTWFTLLANRAMAQGVLRHANEARLQLVGASRAVLRTAWLQGVGLSVEHVGDDGVRLRWQAAERATDRPPGASHSLAALVPLLPWTRRFRLRARCHIAGTTGTFVLTTGDAILPGREPRQFDSELERRFAHDFPAIAPTWDLLREPIPLPTADGLAFPDFELRCRATAQRWLLEITGLRERTALPAKLALLAQYPHYLLCLPQRLVPEPWGGHPRLLAFHRNLAAVSVLRRLERLAGDTS